MSKKVLLRSVLSGLVFLICISMCDAQRLRLGVTASPTFSFVNSDNDDVAPDGNSLGILYGLMADYQFSNNERYSLFTGLNIHHSGGRFSSATARYNVSINLIEIPTIFKLRTNTVNLKSFYGQFGLKTGLPISNKVKDGIDGQADVTGIALSVNIGGGMHYELTENGVALNIGLFFDNGFTNVFKIEGEKFRMKHLGLRAGVYF